MPLSCRLKISIRSTTHWGPCLLLIKSQSLENKLTFIKLWVLEVYRVYYDRLVDSKDWTWLFQLLQKVVKQHFKEDFNSLFKHLASQGGKVTDDDMRSLLFGDYMSPDGVHGQIKHLHTLILPS